jgi:hypothetical protein
MYRLAEEAMQIKKDARCRHGHKIKRGRCASGHKPRDVSKRLQELDVEIQNRDRQLCIIERGVAAVTAAMVYMYFRLGLDSTDVAEQLRLTPTHVHQTIYRLNHLVKKLSKPKSASPQSSGEASSKPAPRASSLELYLPHG